MFEIIGDIFTVYEFMFGICVGAVFATGFYFLAAYIDHRRMLSIAKKHAYESLDLLFSDSYWDQKLAIEIILPEV